MARDNYKDMVEKERESVKEVGGSSAKPSTDRLIKDVGLEKAESAKKGKSASNLGIEIGKEKKPGKKAR